MATVVGIYRFLHDYDQVVVYQDSDGNIKANVDGAFALASPTVPVSADIIGMYNYGHGTSEFIIYQDGAGNVKANEGIT
jgi:hypothetical protein